MFPSGWTIGPPTLERASELLNLAKLQCFSTLFRGRPHHILVTSDSSIVVVIDDREDAKMVSNKERPQVFTEIAILRSNDG